MRKVSGVYFKAPGTWSLLVCFLADVRCRCKLLISNAGLLTKDFLPSIFWQIEYHISVYPIQIAELDIAYFRAHSNGRPMHPADQSLSSTSFLTIQGIVTVYSGSGNKTVVYPVNYQ